MSPDASREKLAEISATGDLELVSWLLAAYARRCRKCGGKMKTYATRRGHSSRIVYLKCQRCGKTGKYGKSSTPA